MRDPLESAQIFEASSRLQSAATTLRKMQKGDKLLDPDRENLKWSGHFLEEVDWTAADCREGVSADLAMQATEVRPSFYATLLHIKPSFQKAGITETTQRNDFFLSTYELLTSGGAQVRPSGPEGTIDVGLAAVFLEELSRSLLVLLNENRERAESDLVHSLIY